MDTKATLQYMLHKKGLPTPIYTTKIIGGSDHQPLWQSSILSEHDNTLYTSMPMHTKIGAEQDAAQLVIVSLLNPKPNIEKNAIKAMIDHTKMSTNDCGGYILSSSSSEDGLPRIAMLVDVENMPNFISGMSEGLRNSMIDIYAFIDANHPLVKCKYPDNVTIILSPHHIYDGPDISINCLFSFMCLYAGSLLSRDQYDEYLVVTCNSFGDALVEIIQCNGRWVPSGSALIKTYDELIDRLHVIHK